MNVKKGLWKIPDRQIAIKLEHIGILFVLGTIILQLLFSLSRETLVCLSFLSVVILGFGVLVRRYHDKE